MIRRSGSTTLVVGSLLVFGILSTLPGCDPETPTETSSPDITPLSSLLKESSAEDCIPPPGGITNWWPGDGNAEDIVGGDDGTMQNGATFVPGKVGQAFGFDGVNDYVSLPLEAGVITENHTMEFWMKSSGPVGYKFIVSSEDRDLGDGGHWSYGHSYYSIFWSPIAPHNLVANAWTWVNNQHEYTTIIADSPYNDGVWHHLAWVKEGFTYRFYIDGALIGRDSNPNQVFTNKATHFALAKHSNGFYWPGMIDEFTIYHRALTEADIQGIYQAGPAGKCKDLSIDNIVANVEQLVVNNVLTEGRANALSAKLYAALRSLDKSNTNTAINQLGAFINQVNAFVRAGILSEADGDMLIFGAEVVINSLSTS